MKTIDECGLPGKLKLWCLQFGLMSRLMWPLIVYEVVMSQVEHIQQCICVFIRKWLGISPNLTSVALYGREIKMQLLLKALTEVFKATKAKVHMALIYSKDQVISETCFQLLKLVGSGVQALQ